MKPLYRSLVATLVGAAIVLAAIWLSDSVVAWLLSIPLEASTLTILLVLFVSGAAVARRGRVLEAAALLAGSGAAWALHEIHPLSLCQSDLPYRSCTVSEMGAMALPAVVLLLAGSVLFLSALTRTRPSR